MIASDENVSNSHLHNNERSVSDWIKCASGGVFRILFFSDVTIRNKHHDS